MGNITPKEIKIYNCPKLKFSIKGADKKTLKINRIISMKLNKIIQKRVLLKIIMLPETGDEINPPRVPDSFSLTKSLDMI